MKVSQLPYERYTLEEGKKCYEQVKDLIVHAKSVDDLLAARKKMLAMVTEYATAASLSNCRFTLNTKDTFYQAEVAYYDEVGPLFQEMTVEYGTLLLDSPFRKELEKHINPRVLTSYSIAKKAFSPAIIEELQQENAVVTEYSTFMSGMVFHYEGEDMPLSVLRGKLEDEDREVRRKACEAIGRGLEANADKLDDIYDRLVKIRDTMAKKMGYRNFIELGYYRMGRMDYDADMVANFRDNVRESLVPCVRKLKEEIGKELGINSIMFYDDAIYQSGATPRPILDKDGIFAAAQEMYDSMNPEVGAFMRSMQENEAFDVEARDGKWGGGYCTAFPKYKQPFILANFNGSSGDVDVMTHEFGHALAAHFVFEQGDQELDVGGMETAECHSMSMEFFSWKYMDKFFGKDAPRYRKRHLLDALSFIPYGVIVDEFQHRVYEKPEMTPAERKQMYQELEAKYRPYMHWEGIPYLEQGTRWQYQMHIYESPFYYIDYCLAQTVAINFLLASQKDYKDAFERYLQFARTGGQKAFGQLIDDAHLPSPFREGSLATMAKEVLALVETL